MMTFRGGGALLLMTFRGAFRYPAGTPLQRTADLARILGATSCTTCNWGYIIIYLYKWKEKICQYYQFIYLLTVCLFPILSASKALYSNKNRQTVCDLPAIFTLMPFAAARSDTAPPRQTARPTPRKARGKATALRCAQNPSRSRSVAYAAASYPCGDGTQS